MNPDPKIIKACIEGSERAMYSLYDHCYHRMMGVCMRYMNNTDDASAALNRAFLKIVTNLKKWDETRSFDAWAKKITINTLIDVCRKANTLRHQLPISPIDELNEPQMPVHLNGADQNLSSEHLERMINELPDMHRTVFNLYALDGYSHAEVADALGCSGSASKWYLHQARRMLKEKLEQFLIEEKKLQHG